MKIKFFYKLNSKASQKELSDLVQVFESDRYRTVNLEGQINDLTELHQVRKT